MWVYGELSYLTVKYDPMSEDEFEYFLKFAEDYAKRWGEAMLPLLKCVFNGECDS